MDMTTNKFINNLILSDSLFHGSRNSLSHTLLVHVSVLERVVKGLQNYSIIPEPEYFEYEFCIGGKCYDMCIVNVTAESLQLLQDFIGGSQFSFPWEDNPTLFINVGSFNFLQEFIRKNNFDSYILKIEEQPGITGKVEHETIKVVTFKPGVYALNIYEKYASHSMHLRSNDQTQYYYTVFAFPWLQPNWLKHFEIPIDNDLYSLFVIILNHLGTINYSKELSIFDLLMLRIALCDYRNPCPSDYLKYELDFMIKRELAKTVKNKHLAIDDYLIAKNYVQIDLLINYLVYEFQNEFDTVERNKKHSSLFTPSIKKSKIHGTIKLEDESDVLSKVNETYNVLFNIDGSNYDKMSLSLFLDLVECPNVNSIRLNTNCVWLKDVCALNRSISKSDGIILVHLNGTNENNFIEDFILSLKTITFSKGGIYLILNRTLTDYSIFDNLSSVSRIEFKNVKIDADMLNGWNQCEIKSKINFVDSTFENKPENWDLLYDLREFISIEIFEDEETFQSLFEFICKKLHKTNSKEFHFDTYYLVKVKSGEKIINFDEIKFTVDELDSKLELRNTFNNKALDLYDLKFDGVPVEEHDYDFYQ